LLKASAMLRITREDGRAGELRLALEGRLVGEWVALLQSELEVSANLPSVVLDLSRVQYTSAEGAKVLRAAEARGTSLLGLSTLLRIQLAGSEP
jgi:anti-anti-sigma regulatory factor